MQKRFLAIGLFILFVAACATHQKSIVRDSYRGLKVAGHTYDVAMTSMGELYKAGLIGDEEKNKAIEYGNYFYAAYHTAVDGLQIYAETGQGDIQGLLINVGAKLGQFLEYVNPILVKHGKDRVE